ncbi:hypothetical protein HID58_083882 [Brassica napus]|uniref:Uncharacterized protein n=1 Tax=Brassica napus TaxID=3708 RepID=A0ABQ7YEU7_BRANA|nr:hypothetical protein HID58_083882 [Brassica napus]
MIRSGPATTDSNIEEILKRLLLLKRLLNRCVMLSRISMLTWSYLLIPLNLIIGYVIVLHSYMQRTLLDPTDKQELEALQQELNICCIRFKLLSSRMKI